MSEVVAIRGRWLYGDGIVYHGRETDPDSWPRMRYITAAGEVLTEFRDDVVRWEMRTACGLLLDGWTREQDDGRAWFVVERRLADRIARPCRRCFR